MPDIGLFDALYSARALRRLIPDPVPGEIITRILDAAIRAPLAGSAQNWAFIVVRDGEQRRRHRSARQSLSDSSDLHTKRPEFFAARFAKVAKNVDGVLVDHLAQFKKRLVRLQVHIGNLLSDLLGAGEDFRR
jgi:nitroreductase